MTPPRTVFLDRLRVVLTALVVLHHTAITYGGSGDWFYREVRDGGAPSSLLLSVFCAVNQAFFMGFFFLIAGRFTPGSLARKGARAFAQERLLRLGLPLLVFGFVLGPLAVALAGVPAGRPWASAWWAQVQQARFVIGPLWFAWALLLFTAAFMLWRWWRPEPAPAPAPDRPVPGSPWWLVSALAVGAVALALRQWVPVGQSVWGLQLGYFASYAFLFALGCAAARHGWLERVPPAQARRWRRVTWLTLPLLFVVAALSGALAGRPVNVNGGLGLAAVVYAFWEPFVAWGLIASLLVLFQRRFNTPSPRWQRWSEQAYGAFVLHAPVLVGVSVALAGWGAPALLKFALVGAASVVLSFALARGLRALPGVRRVL
ncbi:acyltransferase family protein [Hydrogenophaga sp. T2]|uniref:acyltransferase family protein n=1 Tax=Hydrogenophaga sp. T2 TaxID=3132823 RepID=UPI003CF2FB1A